MDSHPILSPNRTFLSFNTSLLLKLILLPILFVASISSSSSVSAYISSSSSVSADVSSSSSVSAYVSSSSSVSASLDRIPYKNYCSSFVSDAVATGLPAEVIFPFFSGYVTKGQAQLSSPESSSNQSSHLSFQFYHNNILETKSEDVFQINANLDISYTETLSHSFGAHMTSYTERNSVYFSLSGFWSASTGKLCMVGHGTLRRAQRYIQISGMLKMNYATSSNIHTSLVTGTIERLDVSRNPFESITLVSYSSYSRNYEYTLTENVTETCSRREVKEDKLKFPSNDSACMYLQSYLSGTRFKLNESINCFTKDCGPFDKHPKFLSLNTIECSEDGKLHLYVTFSNSSQRTYHEEFEPGSALVAEGFWDQKSNRLCLVACFVLVDKATGNVSVGDCTIGLSLWFPSVLTLKSRSTIVGEIWSKENEMYLYYFSTVSFSSYGQHSHAQLPGLKYKYTEFDNLKKCSKLVAVPKFRNKEFPNGASTKDLQFHLFVRDSDGNGSSGGAKVMTVDDTFYGADGSGIDDVYLSSFSYVSPNQMAVFGNSSLFPAGGVQPESSIDADKKVWKISYWIYYYKFRDTSFDLINLYAEGIYNSSTGKICMSGCLDIGEDKTDCNVSVTIQLSPLNPDAGERSTGQISSTRDPKDHLYFNDLKLTTYTFYRKQAMRSIQRMDIEIIMVIVSLTFSCFCIFVQLRHVKKHPDLLPHLSIFMLVILTLGHMIPLLLNFEELFFKNQSKRAVLMSVGGWAQAHKVVVRVITMVAFLLQFRLLERTWSAKMNAQNSNSLWVAEKAVLKLCLPLYLAGGFLTWFYYLTPSSSQLANAEFGGDEHIHTLWKDLFTYSGLVLDGFLLPQMVLNMFSSFNRDKAPLKFIFYFGTTVIRAAPHLYDAYRARHYIPFLNSTYIYASRDDDFYSLVWDVIIPCGGMLFAVLVFLQQRYGGMHIVPKKLRKLSGRYEEVPVVDG